MIYSFMSSQRVSESHWHAVQKGSNILPILLPLADCVQCSCCWLPQCRHCPYNGILVAAARPLLLLLHTHLACQHNGAVLLVIEATEPCSSMQQPSQSYKLHLPGRLMAQHTCFMNEKFAAVVKAVLQAVLTRQQAGGRERGCQQPTTILGMVGFGDSLHAHHSGCPEYSAQARHNPAPASNQREEAEMDQRCQQHLIHSLACFKHSPALATLQG